MHNVISSPLFRLIHCMNKVEKKHFKLYASYHSKNARNMNYLRLFDVMEKQKVYNEKKIVKREIVKKQHLPVLKHYLHNLILESMRVLRSKDDDIDNELNNMIGNVRIMRDKGLAEEEIKYIEKTKNLALKHERWVVALDALLQKRKIMTRREEKNVAKVDEELRMVFAKIKNLQDYLEIHSNVSDRLKKSEMQRGFSNKALGKLMNHPLLRNESKGLSAEATRLYFTTLSQHYYFTGDYKSFLKLLIRNVVFVENHLSFFESPEFVYSSALNNLTIAQHLLKKYPEELITIQKHRTLVKKDGAARMHAFMCTAINETNYYITTGEFEKGLFILERIENEMEILKSKIPYTQQVSLYFNIACICFGVGNYHKSLQCINKITNYPKMIFREDVQVWSRILQILIYYELNTPDILDYQIVSTYRFLLKGKQVYKVEQSILLFIRRLSTTNILQNSFVKEFRKFRDELVQITKDPEEKKALLYFDFISWLESKIQGRSFAEIIREKIKD